MHLFLILVCCCILFCTECTVYCMILYCTVLYCNIQYCTVYYCTVLYCTVLYCIVMAGADSFNFHCRPNFSRQNAGKFRDYIGDTMLYCTVLYCTVLYCTVLYCTVLYSTVLLFKVHILRLFIHSSLRV